MRHQLYRTLTAKLQRRLPASSKPQTRNLALLTQALVFSCNCHLSSLALQLPIEGQLESLTQRLRRFLDNWRVYRQHHYLPFVKDLFAHWPDREVNLVMDRTDIGREKSILVLAAAFKHRALPLAWRVLPFGGTGADLQIRLLRDVNPYLPTDKRITLYGDSEFRAVTLQRYCQRRQWQWQLGVKSDTLFHQGRGHWRALKTIPVQRGERLYLQEITFTQKQAFSPVHLMVDWTHAQDDPRYIVTDRPPDRHSWRRGRKRFWIEPMFRDWKSYGFDLERSQITQDHRLNRLLLAMATATLWLLHLGHWVVATGRAHRLTADHRRDYSLFRLGRDYALRSQFCRWTLPVCFRRPI